jgi:3-hydroxyisobutyrate dehydrogenase
VETVALLGMGLLGSGFARGMLARGGTRVRVYNRTKSKCEPLAALGAEVADTPAEAVRGADRVHLILSADAAVDAVILQLREGLRDGVPVIDHTTCLPASVAIRHQVLRSQGVNYVHAPVFMGPQAAEEAKGLMLLSAPDDEVARLRPLLEPMTGKLLTPGAEPDKGAKLKVCGNSMLFLMLGAMGDLFRIGEGAGLDPEEVLALFKEFQPAPYHMGRRALRSADRDASFEMVLARKDAGLAMQTASGPLRLLPHLAEAMDAAIEAGRGHHDFTSLGHPDHLDEGVS